MVLNFEEYTVELKPFEIKLAKTLAKKISLNKGKKNAVTSKRIIEAFEEVNVKIDGSRVRKLIQYIRQEGLVANLCATSNGYFCAANQTEVEEYIKGLQQRLNSIQYTLDSFQKHRSHVS